MFFQFTRAGMPGKNCFAKSLEGIKAPLWSFPALNTWNPGRHFSNINLQSTPDCGGINIAERVSLAHFLVFKIMGEQLGVFMRLKQCQFAVWGYFSLTCS